MRRWWCAMAVVVALLPGAAFAAEAGPDPSMQAALDNRAAQERALGALAGSTTFAPGVAVDDRTAYEFWWVTAAAAARDRAMAQLPSANRASFGAR